MSERHWRCQHGARCFMPCPGCPGPLDSAGLRGAREIGDAKVSSVLNIKSMRPKMEEPAPRPETVEVPVELLPCPFCGADCDPEGWYSGRGKRGPECTGCSATAESIAQWNSRWTAPARPTAAETGVEAGLLEKIIADFLDLHDDDSGPVVLLRESRDELTSLRTKLAEAEARNQQLNDRNVEVSMLAHQWMLCHDKLKAGEPYSFPTVADLPATIAAHAKRIAELEATDRAVLRFAGMDNEYLCRRIGELEAGLRPFAEEADDIETFGGVPARMEKDNFFRARALLTAAPLTPAQDGEAADAIDLRTGEKGRR